MPSSWGSNKRHVISVTTFRRKVLPPASNFRGGYSCDTLNVGLTLQPWGSNTKLITLCVFQEEPTFRKIVTPSSWGSNKRHVISVTTFRRKVLPPASNFRGGYSCDTLNVGLTFQPWGSNTKLIALVESLNRRNSPGLSASVLTFLGFITNVLCVSVFLVLLELKYTQYEGFCLLGSILCVTSLDYLLPTRKGSNEVFTPFEDEIPLKFGFP